MVGFVELADPDSSLRNDQRGLRSDLGIAKSLLLGCRVFCQKQVPIKFASSQITGHSGQAHPSVPILLVCCILDQPRR